MVLEQLDDAETGVTGGPAKGAAGDGEGRDATDPLDDELGGWSDERLEDGLTTLAGQIAAAMCRFLLLLAEYDRRRGWARWDCVSAAQWLSWRCQIEPRTAREYLRVAHRLVELPAVAEEFRHGRLSYSKVRALTRVATADNEEDLLSLARSGTAAQLERAVAAYRRVGRFDEGQTAEEQLRGRSLRWSYDGDGSMVIRARVPADRGQLVLAALRATLDGALTASDDTASSATDDAETEMGGAADPSAAAGAALDAADAHDLVGTPDGADQPNRGTTSDRHADQHADHSGDLNTHASWAANMTSGRGELTNGDELADRVTPTDEVADDPRAAAYADALVAMADRALVDAERPSSAGDRYQVVVHIDAETLADPTADGDSSLESGRPLEPTTVQRLSCDAALVPLLADATGEPLDVGRKRRSIPTGLRRAVLARDRHCRHPGCTRPIAEIHHIHHWIRGGETKLSNLLGLCWFHHARHHQGAYDIRRDGSGQPIFVLPDGEEVTTPTSPGFSLDELLADLAQRDIEIGADTAVSDWDGDRLDLHLATWILAARGAAHPDGYADGHDRHHGWTGDASARLAARS